MVMIGAGTFGITFCFGGLYPQPSCITLTGQTTILATLITRSYSEVCTIIVGFTSRNCILNMLKMTSSKAQLVLLRKGASLSYVCLTAGLSNPRPTGRMQPARQNFAQPTNVCENYNETIKPEYSTSQSFGSVNTLLGIGANMIKFNSQNSSENT